MTINGSELAHFTCHTALTSATHQHQQAHQRSMNQTDKEILEIILHHSTEDCVAHLPHRMFEELTGRSNSTVRRVIRKLIKLQIIDRIHYVDPINQGLGPNLYVIKPYTPLISLREQEVTS